MVKYGKFVKLAAMLMIIAVILSGICTKMYNVSANTAQRSLTELEWQSQTSHEGVWKNSAFLNSETKIIIGRKTYDEGLSVHPKTGDPADIVYNIDGLGYTTFGVIAGPDATWSNAVTSVQFIILVDGSEKASSKILKEKEMEILTVDISGAKTLTLRVTDGGDDMNTDASSWAMPTLSNGTQEDLKASLEKASIVTTTQPPEIAGAEYAYISDMVWIDSAGHTDPPGGAPLPVTRDTNLYGEEIHIWGEYYEKGLGMHAEEMSEGEDGTYVDINIEGLGFRTFAAYVGIAESAIAAGLNYNMSSVTFVVKVDGKEVVRTEEKLYIDEPELIIADITGGKILRLCIEPGESINSDLAAWGNALVSKSTDLGDLIPDDTTPEPSLSPTQGADVSTPTQQPSQTSSAPTASSAKTSSPTASSKASPLPASDNGGSSMTLIIIIVVLVVVVAAAAVIVFIIYKKKKGNKA